MGGGVQKGILCDNKGVIDILKFTFGFIGILLVGLAGVVISSFLRLGELNTAITTIDNVSHVR
jgi:hypothetical protein